MKKILFSMLCLSLCLFLLPMTVAAGSTTVATADLNTGAGPYETGWMGVAQVNAISGKAVFAKAINAFSPGSLGNDVDDNSLLGHGGYSNGTRRTKLYPLSHKVAAGTYEITVWVLDPDGARTHEGSDFGFMLTFHSADLEDDALKNDWNDSAKTHGALMVFNTHKPASDEVLSGEKHWDGYDGTKAQMAPTGRVQLIGSSSWEEYKATIELTAESGKIAFWLYQWAGYDNKSALQFYVDDVKVSTVGSEDTTITTEPMTDPEATTEPTVTTDPATTQAPQSESKAPSADSSAEVQPSNPGSSLPMILTIVVTVLLVAVALITVLKKKK
ncbi:MAG: hypothetical protein E7618_00665 [Ruminococcaceae bacterium]|nr:hypothetical protein [Oscillospiraceae bacterium]